VKLRPYQTAAIDALYQYWADGRGENPLIVAPTGAGKSAILAKLVDDAMEYTGTRVMILTHVKELLEQNAKTLLRIVPHADIGFYSASIGQKRLDKPITFAGIQSVYREAPNMIPPPDLVLVDEAHLIPKNSETRYGRFISELKQCNPLVKIVGLTATPYRLDSGFLHQGEDAIFDGIAYDIPVGMLMDDGYLSTVISKGSANKIDLTNVKMRGGEFNEADLATAASDPALVDATVKEIVTLGENRNAWLIFASGLGHADMIRKAFLTHGFDIEVVSGEDPMGERAAKIEAFKRGDRRGLINCGVLTTGFDHPAVDLVALVRATASAGLYVQIVGRGTRPVYAPGVDMESKESRLAHIAKGPKPNCMILDYGQNVERHGFIDAIQVKPKGESKGGEAPVKPCPNCQTVNHAAVRNCIECGYEFPAPALNHSTKSYSGAMLSSQVEAEWLDVGMVHYDLHQKEGKPDSVKVTYTCGMVRVSEWLCPDHGGYAASRYQARMKALDSTSMTTADALGQCTMWNWPSRIKIKPRADNPKFNEIVQLDYSAPKPRAQKENTDEEKRLEQLATEMFADEF
jgi:DNA repair protein RadD